jgi:hypothetical protein
VLVDDDASSVIMPPRKTSWFNDSLWKTFVVASSDLLKDTRRCYNYHQCRNETYSVEKVALTWVNFSVDVLSSFVRAVNVFCGLEKYDYLALDNPRYGALQLLILLFSRCDCAGSYNPWKSSRFLPIIYLNGARLSIEVVQLLIILGDGISGYANHHTRLRQLPVCLLKYD